VQRIRTEGEKIRRFIVENLEAHPRDIARVGASHFRVSRQAINQQLRNLAREGAIETRGKTSARTYRLAPLAEWTRPYLIATGLSEDVVWRDLAPFFAQARENVRRIWQYAVTEMVNNVIDHSDGTAFTVSLHKTAASTRLSIDDDGVGIFRKIQAALGLLDERHSVLELAKGKLTTDPSRHSGEGIFFTSRSFDAFEILSGGVYFSHAFGEKEDWILERSDASNGTAVFMRLDNHTPRRLTAIFEEYTSGEDFGFTRTVVPVKLASYGDDNLVSRSQARRLLTRVDRFRVVVLDFQAVAFIGQAFADEIFRVFVAEFPGVELMPVNTEAAVAQMISRVTAG